MAKLARCPRGLLLRIVHTGALIATAQVVTPATAQYVYQTLQFDTAGTFLTGIRGDNIVGDFVISATTDTGGLLYRRSSGTWTPFPVATSSGTNFPGSISSSPYGSRPDVRLRTEGPVSQYAGAPSTCRRWVS